MADRPLRAAVIGCGRVGTLVADDPLMKGDVFTHAEAYARCPATELATLCDTDAWKAQAGANRWGTEAVTDLSAVLRRRPEVVSVCTPTDDHFATVRRIVQESDSVRAILCEKPLATSVQQGEELVGLAKQREVLLAVVYMRRYARNFQNLARFISDGGLGRVQGVSGWYPFGVLHSGTHWFDMLRMLVGEVEWVRADDHLGESGPDQTLDVTLGLTGGAVATLRALDVRHFVLFEMDIVGTQGRVRITDNGFRIELSKPGPSTRTSGLTELHAAEHDFGDRRDLMLHAVEDIVEALREGRAPLATAEGGLAALRVGHAAIASAREGGRVIRLDDPAEQVLTATTK